MKYVLITDYLSTDKSHRLSSKLCWTHHGVKQHDWQPDKSISTSAGLQFAEGRCGNDNLFLQRQQ
jgi:hypothetical protein